MRGRDSGRNDKVSGQYTPGDILDPMSPLLADLKFIFKSGSSTKERFLLAIEIGQCVVMEYWLKNGKYPCDQVSLSAQETTLAAKNIRLDCLQLQLLH